MCGGPEKSVGVKGAAAHGGEPFFRAAPGSKGRVRAEWPPWAYLDAGARAHPPPSTREQDAVRVLPAPLSLPRRHPFDPSPLLPPPAHLHVCLDPEYPVVQIGVLRSRSLKHQLHLRLRKRNAWFKGEWGE